MKSVRLSGRDARDVLFLIEGLNGATAIRIRELVRRALAPKPKRPSAKKREARRATKRERTASLREMVEARARGLCECGCETPFAPANPMELDHFFGRSRAVEWLGNVWALTRLCHRLKTAGRPSPEEWHRRFIAHASVRGYPAEAERARARLAFVQAKSELGRAAR